MRDSGNEEQGMVDAGGWVYCLTDAEEIRRKGLTADVETGRSSKVCLTGDMCGPNRMLAK